ncbi:MAG: glycosidase [Bacteroidetes bacterium]|nr:glycosidase [Rhodothermaceae bacterium RA]RMH50137.1 MAG: glycosidase [Bacteroidota bacterium]
MALSLFHRTPRPILQPDASLPWANGAVFNPGAWYDGERVHLLFRAVPAGYRRIAMPDPAPGEPAFGYADYVSYIGYAESADGHRFALRATPLIAPEAPFDRFGAEDPRLVCFEGTYFITYTALGAPAFGTEDGVRIGLASTQDFRHVEKHGIVGPPVRDKDAVLFPRRIGGRIAMLHRIVPDVQLVYFDDLEQLLHPPDGFWERHLADLDRHVVFRPVPGSWESKKVGAGPTPIETEEGWLLIYHGVDDHYVYRAGLILLDLDDPRRVIARTAEPVLEPTLPFEREGDVPNVVFPEGAAVIDGTLHIYYGAADKVIGHAHAPLADVLALLHEVRV